MMENYKLVIPHEKDSCAMDACNRIPERQVEPTIYVYICYSHSTLYMGKSYSDIDNLTTMCWY